MTKPIRPMYEIIRDLVKLRNSDQDCTHIFQEMIDSYGGICLVEIPRGEYRVEAPIMLDRLTSENQEKKVENHGN